MFRRLAIAAAFIAVATSAVIAQSDPIKERQSQMKELGKASRPVGGMLKGDVPFDLATVQASLDVYIKNAKTEGDLFPDTSKTGGDTTAAPAIWERKADFEALFAKFAADSTAAKAAIVDEASFKANMPGVLKNCGTCHDSFRIKK